MILLSGIMGFTAIDGLLRTSKLTNELFDYPLMASNFARGAQTAFVRIRVAGDDIGIVAEQERMLREDLEVVGERLTDPVAAPLIAHIEERLTRLSVIRAEKTRLIEEGGRLGETLLREAVIFRAIDEDLSALVELAVVQGFDFMLAAEDTSDEVFNIQLFLVALVLLTGLGIAIYLGSRIVKPIRAITAVTSRLATGDDQVQIPGAERRDEIGAMARALKIFKENVRTIRRNEQELIRMQGSLERRVEERTGELAEALKAANAASTAKSEFLATMSHELRTPLNAIIGFSDVIIGKMFGPIGDAKYVDYAEDINKSGQNLLRHIDDILDLSKIEAGKSELTEVTVDVARIVEECIEGLRDQAEAGGIEIERDMAADLPGLIADARKCKQILFTIVSA